MEHDILIPQPQADMLLREAAEREVSAEENCLRKLSENI